MAYHPGCGGKQFGDQRPHTQLSTYSDSNRQFAIDYSEDSKYNWYRTNVCVYKGVRRMKDCKETMIELMNKLLRKLTAKQIEYLYHLGTKLFGETVD
jgi:hypothetical protein